jgi:hypothetical protein
MAFLLVVALLKLPTSDRKTDCPVRDSNQLLCQLDLGGSVLLIASISCLFMAMQWGGQRLP